MGNKPIVIGISGSLRNDSYTYRAMLHALAAAEESGAETEVIDLREWDLPLFDPDNRAVGDAPTLKRTVARADAVIMGTPVYHGMVSSALKNAFDYLGKDEFSGKTVGLLATAGGGSYAQTLEHLRTGVRTVHGWTIPHEVGLRRASDLFDDEDRITDPGVKARVDTLGRMVTEYAWIESRRLECT